MSSHRRTGPRGSVQSTFAVVMGLLLFALCVLGWLLLDQDRSLSEQRVRDHLDDAANLIVRSLADEFGAVQSRLDTLAVRLETGAGPDRDLMLVPGKVLQPSFISLTRAQ